MPSAGVGPDEPALLRPRLAPSPLRSRSTLSFRTVEPGPIEVELLDLSGRRVRQLLSVADAPAGVQRVSIDARSDRGELLPAGVYLYRIRSARRLWSGRLVVAR